MRALVSVLVLAAPTALLVACGQGGGEKGKDEKASAPVAAAAPVRKAGLWEQTTSGTGMPNMTMSICLDAQTDQKMSAFAAQNGAADCSTTSFEGSPATGMKFSNTCNMPGGGTIKTSGMATGDFNSEYTMDVQSETSGSPTAQMNGAHSINIHAVWKGACPAEMKPGDTKIASADLKLPNGMTVKMPNGMTVQMPTGK